MNNFKQATKEKLRFETSKGNLSVEQLWDLKLTPLSTIIKSLKKRMAKTNDDELSFLDESSTPVDKTLELKFNVAKDIYLDKKEEKNVRDAAADKKIHNEKIMALIYKKQEGELEDKTVDELTALLKE